MTSTLHTVRDTASFPARWYLVPFALCALAIATAVVVQTLAAADTDVEALIDVPVAAPARADAHGV